MRKMPPARLKPEPPFTSVMLDLFGSYPVWGEVQKRTTGKAWGVIFTDLCCRAVHLEVVFGNDRESFLLAFSWFTAIRGWPLIVYSDPGSQLVGASEELKRVWRNIDQDYIAQVGASAGCEWRLGPADSPGYQGAVALSSNQRNGRSTLVSEVIVRQCRRYSQFFLRQQICSMSGHWESCQVRTRR